MSVKLIHRTGLAHSLTYNHAIDELERLKFRTELHFSKNYKAAMLRFTKGDARFSVKTFCEPTIGATLDELGLRALSWLQIRTFDSGGGEQ